MSDADRTAARLLDHLEALASSGAMLPSLDDLATAMLVGPGAARAALGVLEDTALIRINVVNSHGGRRIYLPSGENLFSQQAFDDRRRG